MDKEGRFQRCLAEVLRLEGGFVNDPRDPGGATKWGITRTTLQAYTARPATVADVENMSQDTAAHIYRARYWNAVHGDDLFGGIDLCLFDTAVNMGAVPAIRLLQQGLGTEADGVIGPHTLATLIAAGSHMASVVTAYMSARRARYKTLAGFAVFGHGWMNRCDDVEKTALSWVGQN